MLNSTESDLPRAAARKHQLVELDSLMLAVPQDRVTTIVSWSEPAPLPFAPKSVLGIVCIEGRMFTVINAGLLLNAPSNGGSAEKGLLIALTGDEQLALAVDKDDGVIEVTADAINAPTSSTPSLISGILENKGRQILILDVDQLFPSAIRGRERRRRRT